MRKWIASAVAAALVVTAPGLPAYAAAGEALNARVERFSAPPARRAEAARLGFGGTSAAHGALAIARPALGVPPKTEAAPSPVRSADGSRFKAAAGLLEASAAAQAPEQAPLSGARQAVGSAFEGWAPPRAGASYAPEEGSSRPSGLERLGASAGPSGEVEVPPAAAASAAPESSWGRRLLAAAVSAGAPAVLSRLLGGAPADEALDPEPFALTRELLGAINSKREAWGKSPIAMPDIREIPVDAPAAFAVGRGISRAVVAVPAGLRKTLADPKELSGLLVRLIVADGSSDKTFEAYRMALAGSIPGIRPDSSRGESAQAVMRASPAELRRLSTRVLRGFLARGLSSLAGWPEGPSQADQSGAYLTEDPEALALGLGLLSAWRPRPGSALDRRRRLGLKMLSPLFTVDPLRQLARDGVEVGARVARLYDMARYLRSRGGRLFWPQPPPEAETGGLFPPIALRPRAVAPAPAEVAPVNLFERLRRKIKSFFRILPDKDRNAEYCKITAANSLISVGGSFNYTALAGLVVRSDAQAYRLPWIRAVNFGAQLSANLTMGQEIDRFRDLSPTLVSTSYGSAGLFLLGVSTLFFALSGLWYFAALNLVLFGTGFLQSTQNTAATVAYNSSLGDDEAYYNRANAVFTFITSLVAIPSPLIASAFISYFDARLRPVAGNALSYGVYGLIMLAVGLIYRTLTSPKERGSGAAGAVKKTGIWESLAEGFKRIRAIQWKELAQGFKLIWGIRPLRTYLMLEAVAFAVGDPLLFSALNGYIKDVLHLAAPPAFLSHLPVLGSLLGNFVKDKKAVFGLYLAASSLGTAVSSLLLAMFRNKSAADLAVLAQGFRKRLASAKLADDSRAAAAGAAVKEAVEEVLARYRARLKEDPARNYPLWAFRKDILDAAAAAVNAKAFDGAKSPEEMSRLFAETGLATAVSAWAERHREAALKEAGSEARTGLTTLEWWGRWTSVVSGLGWLAYLGVFHAGLWGSVGWMIAAMALQGPAVAVFMSLVKEFLKQYPKDQGKAYAAINFITLALNIFGELVFAGLVAHCLTATVLQIAAVAVVVVAVCDWIQGFKVVPMEQGPDHGPKP